MSRLLVVLLLLTACAPVVVQAQAEPSPTATPTPTTPPTITPSLTRTPTAPPDIRLTPTAIVAAGGLTFGWPGEIQCWNCSPFNAHIRLTHYNPQKGEINCWDWSDEFDYCMSPTFIGVPWEAVWGFGAACPVEWPIGTWIDIEGVGAFICFDRGDQVTCDHETGICAVDLLGPGGAEWDGQEFEDVVLWVPLKPRR